MVKDTSWQAGLRRDFPALETIQFLTGWTGFNAAGREPDIMTEMRGIHATFQECLDVSPGAILDGIYNPFLHVNYLIDNKKFIGRPDDLVDIEALEKIRSMYKSEPGGAE